MRVFSCVVALSALVSFATAACLPKPGPTPDAPAPVELLAGATPTLQGNAVVFGPGTYPRATRLADGTLLGAYTVVENGENVIRTVLSRDEGASWAAQGEVTRGVGDIDNPFVLQLTSGECSQLTWPERSLNQMTGRTRAGGFPQPFKGW